MTAALGLAWESRRRADCLSITEGYVGVTPPQRAVLEDDAPITLWRDGNQIGKSYAIAMEVWDYALGTGRFKDTPQPPVRVLVIGTSWEQMEPLMQKIWRFAPKHQLDPRNGYDPGRGITGKPPRLVLAEGDGKGSVINFATYKQGSSRVAGGTFDLVVMDEPPPETMFGEVKPRVLAKGGRIVIGFTPTPESPDVTWLRRMVEEGVVVEHNHGVTEASCWVEGAPRPWKTQEQLDAYERELIASEREMRMGRSWDQVTQGRWIDAFDDRHVVASRPDINDPDVVFGIGVDHGADAGKQAAMLVAVRQPYGLAPMVWFLDEVQEDHSTMPEEDAQNILAMIERNGIPFSRIRRIVGDRSLEANKRGVKKSNKRLRDYLAAELGKEGQRGIVPFIDTPRKAGGSVSAGAQLLNSCFLRGKAHVHPRCTRFREALLAFDGNPRSRHKDVFDAGRYILERMVQPGKWAGVQARTAA